MIRFINCLAAYVKSDAPVWLQCRFRRRMAYYVDEVTLIAVEWRRRKNRGPGGVVPLFHSLGNHADFFVKMTKQAV